MEIKFTKEVVNKIRSLNMSDEILFDMLETNIIDFMNMPNGEFSYIFKWEKTLTLILEKKDETLFVHFLCLGTVLVNTGTLTTELNE